MVERMSSQEVDFLPIRENLQFQVKMLLDMVSRFQVTSRNQVDKSSSYEPDIACSSNKLFFDAHVTVANRVQPQYYFSVAVPLALSYLSLTLSATKEFMSEVPLDDSMTTREDPESTDLHDFVDYNYLRYFEGGVIVPRKTSDPRRHLIGDDLFSLTLQLIALHEEGHYLNGHLDPKLGFAEKGTYSESSVTFPNDNQDHLLTRRALELDADNFAITAILLPLMMGNPTAYLSNMGCELARNPSGYLRFLGCASMMLGAILWQAEGDHEKHVEFRTHPTPFCRAVHFLRLTSIFAGFDQFVDQNDELWDDAFNRDLTVIGRLFEFNRFAPEGIVDLRPRTDTLWSREWEETRQRLLEIKPEMSEAALRARATVGAIDFFPGDSIELLEML